MFKIWGLKNIFVLFIIIILPVLFCSRGQVKTSVKILITYMKVFLRSRSRDARSRDFLQGAWARASKENIGSWCGKTLLKTAPAFFELEPVMKTAPRSRDPGLFQREPEPIKKYWLKGFLLKCFLQIYFTVITYLKYQMLKTFSILHILITLAYYYDTK